MGKKSTVQVVLIAVGDELLSGRTLDSNSNFIAGSLNRLGAQVTEIVVVPDQAEVIEGALSRVAASGVELIITTGGLGPTSDDITRFCIARVAGASLVEDASTMSKLVQRAKCKGRELYETGKRQAQFPEGATIVENKLGTANAFITDLKVSERIVPVFSLPGVPAEMKNLLEAEVKPFLLNRYQNLKPLRSSYLRCFGFSESWIGSVIERLELAESINVAYRPVFPEIMISLSAKDQRAEAELADAGERVSKAIGSGVVYSTDPKDSMVQAVARMCQEKGVSLAIAESCTGGLIASKLVSREGATKYFQGGVVSYSDDLKISALGVPPQIISSKGAVSREVAAAMAEGIRSRTAANIGVSSTGIAGPDGGSEEKPVGTVFLGISTKDETIVIERCFPYSRNLFREITATSALDLVRRHLSGLELDFKIQ